MHRYSFGPSKIISHPGGAFILSFITLTIVVVAFLFSYFPTENSTVTLLIRGEDGTRSLATFALGSGEVTRTGDGASVSQQQEVALEDGTVVLLDAPGLVQRVPDDPEAVRVLIASPVAPSPRTPFAVWERAARVAWVSPADASVQVFAWNGKGYSPVGVFTEPVQSLGFVREDLLVGTVLNGSQTEILAFDLATGAVTNLATLDGLISIVTP